MKLFQNKEELQDFVLEQKRSGKRIGFVPTMGNLHDGHLSLVKLAQAESDIVIVSIFVNPMQFGPNEDFDAYPRTFEQDKEKLDSLNTDILFLPNLDSIYPRGKENHTKVEAIEALTKKLCGASRPGHFLGVTTVVNILLNIVQPDIAVFGKKDYQQLMVIKRMVSDLCMPIKIIGGDIKREPNGLAMSSRNGYLSQIEKDKASHLRAIILAAQKQIEAGDTNFRSLEKHAIQQLTNDGFKVDYFHIVRQDDLESAKESDSKLLIAAAAWLGQPRLIDNQEVNLERA
ncbi:pantoate--beta-alanine ligase [Pleionea sediminis]|uniref:pantoate--beta-alanine ligase n=1 Tax=Pleionea sediminis TaxID=2569479 RepID=UPI00118484CE|nr:pantoate--beta-alanine ligase [Pleionea sediminis]